MKKCSLLFVLLLVCDVANAGGATMERGRALFAQCRACHTLHPGEASLMKGPTLFGVFGRKAGALPGYGAFSSAMRATDWVWDRAQLDRYLTDPAQRVPNNLMAFVGVANADDRAALLDFLERETKSEPPIADDDENATLTLRRAR